MPINLFKYPRMDWEWCQHWFNWLENDKQRISSFLYSKKSCYSNERVGLDQSVQNTMLAIWQFLTCDHCFSYSCNDIKVFLMEYFNSSYGLQKLIKIKWKVKFCIWRKDMTKKSFCFWEQYFELDLFDGNFGASLLVQL